MAKKEKNVEEESKLTVQIVYRIFEMMDFEVGHLREPKRYDEYIFDHYSGYSSIEKAAADIERHDNNHKNLYGREYVIIPIVKTVKI